ncbi:hypothetical protein P7C71_g301, partial [Lecanoromycetidae sp. Uapishka_2]
MYKSGLALFAVVASSIAWTTPIEYIEERHVLEVTKRQADVNQLLQLASLAGITALPTDPAVLLQLGPLANSLASALPTSSVLAVLLTAAPSGFVSSIVNDPSYAASFESAFSAGNSPSWFNALPTDVRSYLHTYSGFGGLATAAGAIKGVQSEESAASSGASGASATGGSSTTMGSSASEASVMSASSASAASMAAMSATSVASTEGNTATSAAAGGVTSSTAKGAAAQATGAIAVGLAGAAGILGLAIAL